MHPDWRDAAEALAAEAIADGDPTAWFDRLYAAGRRGDVPLPWDRGVPNQLLVKWAGERSAGHGRAVVVGCGLGQESEFVGRLGYDTTAFDISPTVISLVRQRFPDTPVNYVVGDLFAQPPQWRQAFDLVVEIFTVQALPPELRSRATAGVRDLVAPGGTLMLIYGMRDDDAPVQGPPWLMTRADIDAYGADGVEPVSVELIADPGARYWLAEFRRHPA